MLRCITIDKETIISTNCEKKTTKKLSEDKQLLCPNCQSRVIFKPGRVKMPHFAHYGAECVVTNSEPETAAHIKGKKILYEWLNKKFPTAKVQYEVYIPETRQIADIFVVHSEKGMEGLRWAFEFQHSSLSPTDWEARHDLYKSEGIQDFWVLDQAKFMKFSTAQDITDARRRNELEKTIYKRTGLCYFLDVDSSELTIDFEFTTSYHTTMVRGVPRQNEYTYHKPIHHSTNIDKIRIRMNDEFKHGVLIYSEIESQMEEQLSWVLAILRGERTKKEELELQEKAKAMKRFVNTKYEKEKAEIVWQFMKKNKEERTTDDEMRQTELTHDIRHLSEEDFFKKYEVIFGKLLLDIEELRKLKDSEGVMNKVLGNIMYEFELYSLPFLKDQGSRSLEDYLKDIHQKKIDVVTYVYDTYKNELEKLASMNFRAIKRILDNIKPYITPWEENPTPIDYALRYGRFETREGADAYMEQVKKKIIDYNPFADPEY